MLSINIEEANRIAGLSFCASARQIINGNSNSHEWWNGTDILQLANEYNINGVFAYKNAHWRLVTNIQNQVLTLYVPLNFYNRGTTHKDIPTNAHLFWVTNGICEELRKNGLEDHFTFGGSRTASALRDLETIGYQLNMINLGLIQLDAHNCGPLVAYAALVANKHTLKYRTNIDWNEILNDFHVRVI